MGPKPGCSAQDIPRCGPVWLRGQRQRHSEGAKSVVRLKDGLVSAAGTLLVPEMLSDPNSGRCPHVTWTDAGRPNAVALPGVPNQPAQRPIHHLDGPPPAAWSSPARIRGAT